MSNWKYTLKLKDVYHSKEITIQELGKIVSQRLRKLANSLPEDYKDEALDLAENFECVDDVAEFDGWMAELYDLGDTKLSNAWPPDKLIWIETF